MGGGGRVRMDEMRPQDKRAARERNERGVRRNDGRNERRRHERGWRDNRSLPLSLFREQLLLRALRNSFVVFSLGAFALLANDQG